MTKSTRPCPTCGDAIPTAFQKSGPKYCSDGCKPRCAFEGCEDPRRKREWCYGHYGQWHRTGTLSPLKKWNAAAPCRVCEEPKLMKNSRLFCSVNCKQLYYAHGGDVPSSTNCVLCDSEIDLTVRGRRGQRKKACTKLCAPCRQDYRKYKMSARQLALRDGPACGICGDRVDINLSRAADPKWCPSVDHITPRSLGGTHEPGNLQLAHLYCNQVKSDRVTK